MIERQALCSFVSLAYEYLPYFTFARNAMLLAIPRLLVVRIQISSKINRKVMMEMETQSVARLRSLWCKF